MSTDIRLHEVLASLLRDERLARTWSALSGPLVEGLTTGVVVAFEEAVYERARSWATAANASLRVMLCDLADGFRRLSESLQESRGVTGRLDDLRLIAVEAAGLGYCAGLQRRLDAAEESLTASTPVDPLTGILRPGELREQLILETLRCQRMDLPLGLLAIARSSGGVATQDGAGLVLRENVRRYDCVGSLDRETILVVLPDVTHGGLGAAAERLRLRLSEDARTRASDWRFVLSHLDLVDVPAADLLADLQESRGGGHEDELLRWI